MRRRRLIAAHLQKQRQGGGRRVGVQLEGMTYKIVIDATTPVPPDDRGNFGQKLDSPQRTDEWRRKLAPMLKELQK